MKILHVIITLNSGGAEMLLKESLPIMDEKGVQTEVLLLSSGKNIYKKELEEKGIKIYETGIKNIYSPMQIFKMGPFFKEYDIVHTHLFPTQYWGILAKKIFRTNIPIVTTEHSTNNTRRKYKGLRWIEKLIYNNYNKIICISEDAKKSLVSWVPKIKDKTTVIYNGVNLKKFQNAKAYNRNELLKDVEIDKNSKLILMVSRFSKQKDQKTLLKAAKLLPNDYHVIFVGKGPLKEETMSLTEELNISNRVHFLGYRNDVERLVKSVDIYVQSSHWEGFGIAALEAMAAGTPVIASDVPGLSQVVEGGGILFPKGDHISLANSIEDICVSKEKYEDIASKCKIKSKEFSIEEMVNQYIQVYSELINI